MKTLRHKAFETNSSSAHSICILPNEVAYYDDVPEVKVDASKCRYIEVYLQKFGFSKDELRLATDFNSKIAYLLLGNPDLCEEFMDAPFKLDMSELKQMTFIHNLYKPLNDVLMLDYIMVYQSNPNTNAVIDYDSRGLPRIFLTNAENEMIKKFLFSSTSKLIIDDDNLAQSSICFNKTHIVYLIM